ncbi:MAG: SUMF1/EgtB/PvdO family nonheme iron enzyme, partial [Armatimonadetes bacterium]|nr:SUMF1/EgtB/PvdO family nonheme iron enzyme [Armatimonadota bacterium]
MMLALLLLSAAQDKSFIETLPESTVEFQMVPIPGGTVTIGDEVVPVLPFYMATTETPWEVFDQFLLSGEPSRPYNQTKFAPDAIARPSRSYILPDLGWGHQGYPVINVSSTTVMMFCRWLSSVTGRKYRVPTEAEWELACRAGDWKAKNKIIQYRISPQKGLTKHYASTFPVEWKSIEKTEGGYKLFPRPIVKDEHGPWIRLDSIGRIARKSARKKKAVLPSPDAGDNDNAQIAMLERALKNPISFWHNPELIKLNKHIRRDPSIALEFLTKMISEFNFTDLKGNRSKQLRMRRIVKLTGRLGNREILELLHKCYFKCPGTELQGLRKEIILAIRIGGPDPRRALIAKHPTESLSKLRGFILKENDPEPLLAGLRALSSIAKKLDQKIQKQIKGKLPDYEITVATRKVE